MTQIAETAALVLFSGSQDSATCLTWALERFERVETIGFDYAQRHRVELDVHSDFRARLPGVVGHLPGRLGEDHFLCLDTLGRIYETAMTREVAIESIAAGLPTTFVPGRNLLFFTYAAAVAYRRGIGILVGGMCETNYSGYPDCRDETQQTLAKAVSLGLDREMKIATPPMWLDKAATWKMAEDIGGKTLVDLVIKHTHTCYLGDREHRHVWGYGCGSCPACELREKGWR